MAHLGGILGLNKEDIARLQRIVLASEIDENGDPWSPMTFRNRSTTVTSLGNTNLVAKLRAHTPAGSTFTVAEGTADAVLYLADHPPAGVAALIAAAGRVAGALLDPDLPEPSSRLLWWVRRGTLRWVRPPLRRWLRGSPPSGLMTRFLP